MANSNQSSGQQGQGPIDANQVKIASDLSNAISSLNAQIETANNRLNQVSNTLGKISSTTKGIDTKPITSMSDGIRNITEQAQKTDQVSLGGFSKQLDISSNATAALEIKQELMQKRTKSASKALNFFGKGLVGIGALSKMATGLLFGLAKSIGNIGLSILAIPMKVFNAFIGMANDVGPGSTALAEAIEGMRKEFGKLSGPGPATIKNMATSLKGFSATGLSAFSVFGDLAKRIQDFTKLAVALGPAFNNFRGEIEKNSGAILGYQKGLGLSDEEMRTVANTAQSMGTTLEKVLEPMRAQAQNLGDQFAIDSKLISRDMARAMKDLKHFAGATVKEIAAASVYSRKLGLELDKITGILDAFETFDTAAENASKLSQAFGVNIDAFKMMESQDPAGPIEMLRKQFAAAGVDASKFNRQQMKLLTGSTNLSEEEARLAFSLKNRGMSLDEIKKKASANEKKQLSQAEAMKKLADNIERLVFQMDKKQGGFFSRFFQGIVGGIQGSKEFITILNNINRGLYSVEMIGVRLAQSMIKMFPGIKGMMQGIAEFFSPRKYSGLFTGISTAIKSVRTGSMEEMKSFKEQIDKSFLNFFNVNSSAGNKVFQNFKIFGKTIFTIFLSAGQFIFQEIGKMKDKVIQEITKPGPETLAFRGWLGRMFEGISKFINWHAVPFVAKVLDGILQVFKNPKGGLPKGGDFEKLTGGIFEPLFYAFRNAWETLYPKVQALIFEFIKKIPGMLLDSFAAAPFEVKVLLGLNYLAGPMGKGISSLASNFLIQRGMNAMAENITKQVASSMAQTAGKVAAEEAAKAGGKAAAEAGASAMSSAMTSASQSALASGGPAAAGAASKFAATGMSMGGTVGVALAVGIGAGLATYGAVSKIDEIVTEHYDQKAKEVSDAMDRGIGNIAKQIDVETRQQMIAEEIARIDKQEAEMWWVSDKEKFAFEAQRENLRRQKEQNKKLLDQAGGDSKKATENFQKMLKEDQDRIKKAADDKAAAENKKKQLELLGPVTIENAAERFKKIDDLAKKVMAKDFNLKKTLDQVSDMISNTEFTLNISDEKEKQINSTLLKLDGIRLVAGTITDIGILVNKAQGELAKMPARKAGEASTPLAAAAEFVKEVVDKFGDQKFNNEKITAVGVTLESIKTLTDGMSQVAKNIKDAKSSIDTLPKKEVLKAAFSNLEDIAKNSVSTKVEVVNPKMMTDSQQNLVKVYDSMNAIAGVLTNISKIKFPTDVDIGANVITMNDGIKSITNQSKETFINLEKSIKEVFDVKIIESLQNTIKSITASVDKATSTDIVNTENLSKFYERINSSILQLTKVSNLLKSIERIEFPKNFTFVENMNYVNLKVNDLASQSTDTFKKLGTYLDTAFDESTFKNVDISIRNASRVTSFLNSAINDSRIKQDLIVISDMIRDLNKINSVLNEIPKIKPEKLQMLADKVGLKGKVSYTLNAPTLKLNIDFTVVMNAEDMEKALVLRSKSFIRERINFATDTPNDTATDKLPEKPDGAFASPPQAKPKLT